MYPTRRDLLVASSALGPLALMGRGARAQSKATSPPKDDDTAPLFKVSLAQWSNNRALFGGEMTHMEWISSVRKDHGIAAIEFVNAFFKDKACDWEFLGEMKQRAADAGTRMLLIMIDGEGALAAESDAERTQAIDKHRKWVVAASYLGCHSIRVNAAGSGDAAEMQKRAADSLVQLASYGESYGVDIIVENHGGNSSNGKWLAGVMKIADSPHVGTLPDFGNFRISEGNTYDRYQGVTDLMPYAKAVSAKSHEFDEAGNEIHTDYARMLKIVCDAGYRGHLGIEYEGTKHSETEGIRLTHQLLLRVRESLS